jgi:hypothetical protein
MPFDHGSRLEEYQGLEVRPHSVKPHPKESAGGKEPRIAEFLRANRLPRISINPYVGKYADTSPHSLCIDEIGYLSYSNRHADVLFELISRRYEQKSTLVTTNRSFFDWSSVFPNAACVVSLVDRLVHNSEIVVIEGESCRAKGAREQAEQRKRKRRGGKSCPQPARC